MADNAQTEGSRIIWMVRAGRGGVYADHFLSQSVVAIGWADLGEIQPNDSDEDINRRYSIAYPDHPPRHRASSIGQVKRFIRNIKIGDKVATYDPSSRIYHLGEVTSDARIESRDVAGENERKEYVRSVKWVAEIPRDNLSQSTRQSLGIPPTLFNPSSQASAEVLRAMFGEATASADDQTYGETLGSVDVFDNTQDDGADTEEDLLESYLDRSEQFIEDEMAKLNWEQMQELVAGILRAMGYRTRVSPRGPDRGVDVFASPDGLGLEEPRISVEVKHRSGRIGAPDIRAFLGGRQPGDRCLYVSTGGFTNEARYEAERSAIPIRLITMPDLRELLVDYYELLDSETRALVPLKRVYWPTRVE